MSSHSSFAIGTFPDAPPPVASGRIAGFWIRVLADLLDALFLAAVGWLLSLPLRALFLRLGEDGVFIGLALSLLYAGVLQSRLGGGRTLGKRLLGLRVVKLDGSLLSVDRSLIRYAAVSFMVYQNSIGLAAVTLLPFLHIEWVQIFTGTLSLVLFLGCVLVVPFHPLKRGLHDLLVGSLVIRGGMPDPVRMEALKNDGRDRIIVISAATLLAVSLLISFVLARPAATLPAGIARGQSLAADLPLQNVRVTDTLELGAHRRRTIMVSGFVPAPPSGGEPDFAGTEQTLLQRLRGQTSASDVDRIGTNLRTGFNIGIFSSYRSQQRLEDARTGQ
jgi:uncharacterized RDD family membrane protein YckC